MVIFLQEAPGKQCKITVNNCVVKKTHTYLGLLKVHYVVLGKHFNQKTKIFIDQFF